MKYWLVMNSWGRDYGEDGIVKIIRGVDYMAIESIPVSAIPEIARLDSDSDAELAEVPETNVAAGKEPRRERPGGEAKVNEEAKG